MDAREWGWVDWATVGCIWDVHPVSHKYGNARPANDVQVLVAWFSVLLFQLLFLLFLILLIRIGTVDSLAYTVKCRKGVGFTGDAGEAGWVDKEEESGTSRIPSIPRANWLASDLRYCKPMRRRVPTAEPQSNSGDSSFWPTVCRILHCCLPNVILLLLYSTAILISFLLTKNLL